MAAAVLAAPAFPPLPHPSDQQTASRLTLAQLLAPDLWDLPEWNGPQ